MVRRSRLVVALAVALVGVVTVGGCSGSTRPTTAPTTRPTPLAKLDVATVRIARVGFCDRVPAAVVRHALGAEPEAHTTWGNGDPIPGRSGSGDVGHEIGCAWTGPAGATARAWVFGRPVTTDFAGTVASSAARQKGCTTERTPTFGSPALLQTCPQPAGLVRVRRAGLLGDSWLTCELTGATSAAPRARLDDWCAAVVAALDVGATTG